MERTGKATVILSGGAPNSTLMSGALAAIWEHGKTFDHFYTSGAGATVGMMFLAPRRSTPAEAMEAMTAASVSDPIWNMFPVGYKAFFKHGPYTQWFQQCAQMFKIPPAGPYARLYNDAVDFWFATWTPSDVTFFSEGVCSPYPFLEEFVDLERLRRFPGQFFMNAYNISRARMEEFGKHEADVRHFSAALAFPFVYPSVEIEGDFYSEGSDRDPINFPNLIRRLEDGSLDTDTLVLIDVLGSLERCLVRRPRNLADAYGISILTPIVSLALKNKEHFRDTYLSRSDVGVDFIELTFDIPPGQAPFVADWSYSNMTSLFYIGKRAGEQFVSQYGHLLPDRAPEPEPSSAAAASRSVS